MTLNQSKASSRAGMSYPAAAVLGSADIAAEKVLPSLCRAAPNSWQSAVKWARSSE